VGGVDAAIASAIASEDVVAGQLSCYDVVVLWREPSRPISRRPSIQSSIVLRSNRVATGTMDGSNGIAAELQEGLRDGWCWDTQTVGSVLLTKAIADVRTEHAVGMLSAAFVLMMVFAPMGFVLCSLSAGAFCGGLKKFQYCNISVVSDDTHDI
jgi:hypothetical protein